MNVVCAHSGLEFEARSKSAKQHPKVARGKYKRVTKK